MEEVELDLPDLFSIATKIFNEGVIKSLKTQVTHWDFSLKNRTFLQDLRYFGEIVGLPPPPPPPRLTLQLVPHRRERLIGETDDESRREQSH